MSSHEWPIAGEPGPLNPYASSSIGDAPVRPREPSAEEPVRHYQARLTWSDREALLRSVGPTRVAAVFTALLFAKTLYDLTRWFRSSDQSSEFGLVEVLFGISACLSAIQGVLVIYTCWLDWRYAEELRRVAGGSSAELGPWSRLHYRTAWLSALAILLTLGIEVLNWLALRALIDVTREMLPG